MPEPAKHRSALSKLLLTSCAILIVGFGLCGVGSLTSHHRPTDFVGITDLVGAFAVVISTLGLLTCAVWGLILGVARLIRKRPDPS